MGSSTGIKDLNTIIQSLISEILSKQPNANVTVGTFIRDLLVDIPAGEMAAIYTQVEVAQKAQSISLAEGDHLDRLLANYALYRRVGTKAIGTTWFQTTTAPGTNLIIPAGTKVRTSMSLAQDSIEFSTTQTVTMIALQANTYYNADEDVYEVSAPIAAILSGVEGNVGPYTLIDIVPSMTIVKAVNKTATSGGEEEETDDVFRSRGLSVLMGSNVGTREGYEILVETIAGVLSAIVVDPNDSEMERVKDGGGADVWIATTGTTEVTDTYVYPVGEQYYILLQQPVKNVSAVKEGGSLLVPEHDYALVRDTSVYGRSPYANDKVVWITPRSVGSSIEITYGYADIVKTAQDYLNNDKNHVVGVEVVAKLCYEATVDITMTVEMFSGYDPTTVISLVNSQIVAYINALPLGNDIQQSDIIGIAEDTAGVDSVVLPITTFEVVREISGIVDGPDEIEGISTGTHSSNLKLRRFEYAKAGTVIVNYYV